MARVAGRESGIDERRRVTEGIVNTAVAGMSEEGPVRRMIRMFTEVAGMVNTVEPEKKPPGDGGLNVREVGGLKTEGKVSEAAGILNPDPARTLNLEPGTLSIALPDRKPVEDGFRSVTGTANVVEDIVTVVVPGKDGGRNGNAGVMGTATFPGKTTVEGGMIGVDIPMIWGP
jgi:hypothetical protein